MKVVYTEKAPVSYTHLDVYKRQEEVCRLTMEFYRRNYIEGLFLSSGVKESPDRTMEELLCTVNPVSYTHLDVYKRQRQDRKGPEITIAESKKNSYTADMTTEDLLEGVKACLLYTS